METITVFPQVADPLVGAVSDSGRSPDTMSDSGRSPDTMSDGPTLQTENENVKESKRQKLYSKHERHPNVKSLDALYNNADMACAFCHSFRTTEVSGPMLHYANGKPITTEEAYDMHVVHVHQKCVEWAPQVYFSGETAVNLKVELSRASKLKCSKCGLKGAALGCYYKSCRRSFHIPCAFEILDCRWDYENYHVLCPLHSSKELPCDKSNCREKFEANNSLSDKVDCRNTPNESIFSSQKQYEYRWTAAPHATSGWILCGSALSTLEKGIVDKFANLTDAMVTEIWKQNVTHVIASIDDRGACSRTFKVLMATLRGKWVLTIDWVKACMEARHPVAEEPYEIGLDIHGCINGPKKGRLRAMQKAPKLFAGLKFYFSGYFKLALKGTYEDLVRAAGGAVLSKDSFLISQDMKMEGSPPMSYVVYNSDPPQDCSSRDGTEIVRRRHDDAKAFAAKTGAQVVDQAWLVDGIAASSLEPP